MFVLIVLIETQGNSCNENNVNKLRHFIIIEVLKPETW